MKYLWIVDYENWGDMDYELIIADNEKEVRKQLKDEEIKPSQVELITKLDEWDNYQIVVGDRVGE